jgi:molybdopterin molybdotransferase
MEGRVGLDQAFEIVDRSVRPLPAEAVEVMLAGGRVLAERASAWVDVPGADISALDGWALRSAEAGGGALLKVAGVSSFSAAFEGMAPAGSCVKVFAGSLLPEGLDAVAGNEIVEELGEDVMVREPVSAGQGMRRKADEFRVGEAVAERGVALTPGWISFLIAAGWSEVKAVTLPRARVIAVGDEILPPGRALSPGEVYPSAASGIVAWLRMIGVTDVRLNLVADDQLDIQEAVPRAHQADVIITLGGTGMSERDVVISALTELGVEFQFRGITARPGHYSAFGLKDGAPVICLPGGPSGAEMMFQLLVRRAVYALMGMPGRGLPAQWAELASDVKAGANADRLARVRLESGGGSFKAVPLPEKGIHRGIAEADGILRVRAGEVASKGDQVEVWTIK